MTAKSSTKTKSSALQAYCKEAAISLVCPCCGSVWYRNPGSPNVICYGCRGKVRIYPEKQQREDERRKALHDLPEAIRKTKRGKFTVAGREGVWALHDLLDADLDDPLVGDGFLAAAVPWGDSNWRAKTLRRIEK